jgi:hypothetical protein
MLARACMHVGLHEYLNEYKILISFNSFICSLLYSVIYYNENILYSPNKQQQQKIQTTLTNKSIVTPHKPTPKNETLEIIAINSYNSVRVCNAVYGLSIFLSLLFLIFESTYVVYIHLMRRW